MERLPQELLAFVIEYLSERDLAALRLVTWSLAATATPALFHTITLWFSIKSLKRLTRISEHPTLAQHVRALVSRSLEC